MKPRPLTLLCERERWFACAKPPGLLTVPPPRGERRGEIDLVARLRSEGHAGFAVHRLDRETSGVVLLARDPEARDRLMRVFKERRVAKRYLAFVQGHLRRRKGVLRQPIEDLGATARIHPRGQPAETSYRVLRVLRGCDLIEAEPSTGRHNQIRLHLADLGHPLVGERKFARGRDDGVRHKRCALHASRLSFTCPFEGEAIDVEAPLPRDLENLLARVDPDLPSTTGGGERGRGGRA